MVKVTRLNGKDYILNSDLIETVEETPDTVITLVNDKKLIVREKTTEIIDRIIEYNRKIYIAKSRIS